MTTGSAEREAPEHEVHFESLARQREAARFGMWVFLTSEILLFGALFSMYATQRAHHPEGYAAGVHHADLVIGSTNTVVLLVSSYLVAHAVHALRAGGTRLALRLTAGTILLGLVFLGLKAIEYVSHVREGAVPGGGTTFYEAANAPGLVSYFNLYWISTSLHGIHVVIGLSVLALMMTHMARGRLGAAHAHRLEMGALYWHLVDAIWIFLWPLYYLMR